MITPANDVATLMEAVNRGDESALPILADAMEECGDARAVGLRLALMRGYTPGEEGLRLLPTGERECYLWRTTPTGAARAGDRCPCWVPRDIFAALTGGSTLSASVVNYRTLSLAYLALAEALGG